MQRFSREKNFVKIMRDGQRQPRRQNSSLLLLLALAAMLAGCLPAPVVKPAAEGTQELKRVALGVGFVPNVQFTPLYVGIRNGFFADEGIELVLEYGFENDYLALVGKGDYQFMIGSGDQVVIGRSQGLPVRYVAAWYADYPVVAFSLAEKPIATAADLAGKVVGLPGPYGANYVALHALLDAAGLRESDIKMESIGFTQAAAVSEGRVEVGIDYAANGPVVLAQAGIETTQVTLDGATPIPANGLVTNDATIAGDPRLVQGMVNALLRSIAWTQENPDEAFAIALTFVPEAGGANEAANRAVFDASVPFWTRAGNGVPGATNAADWAATAELLARIGLAAGEPPVEELFTNDFVAR